MQYSEELLRRGILDKVLLCSRMENNHQQCIFSLSQIVSNIVCNNVDDARQVLEHDVFGLFILPLAKSPDPKKNENALYSVVTIVLYKTFNLTEMFLKQYGGLEILVEHLRVDRPHPNTVCEILNALVALVQTYEPVYNGERNKIVVDLESLYNITNVLAILEENMGSRRVQAMVSMLLEIMYGS